MTAADASGTRAAGSTLDDPLAEALRVIALADERGLLVRLMGGLAFHAQAPTWTARVDRDGRDIDLATRAQDRTGLSELLVSEGYTPDRQYNALYGHKQMYFMDPARGRPVDVIVDRLEMCHTFEFRDRLAIDRPTVPLADGKTTSVRLVLNLEKTRIVNSIGISILIEVLENENEQLLERQRELYATPGPLAEKWRTACVLTFQVEDVTGIP